MDTNIFAVAPLAARDIPGVLLIVKQCVCCWRLIYPGDSYPGNWSSTLCAGHAHWTRHRRKKQAEEQI